jgi:tRNA 2-thiouridine synthesizing protein A
VLPRSRDAPERETRLDLPDDDDDELLTAATLAERTANLQQQVRDLQAEPCAGCGAALCGHGSLLNVVFGSRHKPRCRPCLAEEHGEDADALLERAWQWIRRRDCFLHVWRESGAAEGYGTAERPPCMFPAGSAGEVRSPAVSTAATAAAPPTATASYDAGDLGCGDLVLELRFRLRELPGGSVLHVTARDPAAPVDLPAWCGLCGHTLLYSSHPEYWIRSKGA